MELRLFPLADVVLFPGMSLALQVFEPRYRQLVAECIERDEPFGVALIREGVEVGGPALPYDVGTTARIRSAATDERGLLHIVTAGGRRFRALAFHHDRSYLWAEVEYVSDTPLAAPPELLDRAIEGLDAVMRLRSAVANGFERRPHVRQAAGALADAIAALAEDAPPQERQRILELTDVVARLTAALPLLDGVLADARRNAAAATSARWSGLGMSN